ncbi:MAG: glycosyltransferase family 2 protein [Alphaproteobacteria bacterium]|nr:glycosyltransferase family 2 protein [Alphaproteobacteria bacterium]
MTPIIIRTKDRPHYLHTTLKSLTATELDNSPITIIDDCSTDKIMIDYLFTDKLIKLNDFTWYDEIKK